MKLSAFILQKINSATAPGGTGTGAYRVVKFHPVVTTSTPRFFTQSSKTWFKHFAKCESGAISDLRMSTAPWIRIGEFHKGLMSHLSTFEIWRALIVLKLCSYDFLIDRSMKLIKFYRKFGNLPLVQWPVRKTFFDQFVGGETVQKMTKAVESMNARGLQLMFCPVLEEDIEDERSSSQFYDDNLTELTKLVDFTAKLEKKKPMFHLKPSAIMPAATLEKVSQIITTHCSHSDSAQLARLVEELAKSIDRPEALSLLKIDQEESKYFFDGIRRCDVLVRRAMQTPVPVHVLVDGEFYSCKPAISLIALALMARYNGNGHFVGTTIQSYLKEALPTIRTELDAVTKHIRVNWFGKIVRGAYMDRERLLAKKRGHNSPIWDTYEETNTSYNACVQHVLEHIAQHKNSQTHLVVAGHNERSIRLAAQKMKDLDIAIKDDLVSFAQIYGMSDYLSTPLVQEGYSVYKSTPFGPIAGVLPYLARRASENRSVIRGAREERNMLGQELKIRFSINS